MNSMMSQGKESTVGGCEESREDDQAHGSCLSVAEHDTIVYTVKVYNTRVFMPVLPEISSPIGRDSVKKLIDDALVSPATSPPSTSWIPSHIDCEGTMLIQISGQEPLQRILAVVLSHWNYDLDDSYYTVALPFHSDSACSSFGVPVIDDVKGFLRLLGLSRGSDSAQKKTVADQLFHGDLHFIERLLQHDEYGQNGACDKEQHRLFDTRYLEGLAGSATLWPEGTLNSLTANGASNQSRESIDAQKTLEGCALTLTDLGLQVGDDLIFHGKKIRECLEPLKINRFVFFIVFCRCFRFGRRKRRDRRETSTDR